MRCPTCQYALWNIESRTCPECGSRFAPSQFRFQPDTVKFCCPHCRQAYFGTDPDGLLSPRGFTCIGCQQAVTLDEMILAPAEGVDEDDTRGPTVRWLEAEVIGTVPAFFGTVFDALFRPGRLGQALPVGARLRPALWFAAATVLIYGTLGFTLLLMVIVLGSLPAVLVLGNNPRNPWPLLLFIPVGAAMAGLVIAAVFAAWSGLTHGLLRLTGPVQRGYSATLQTFAYTHAANVLAGVPCAGISLLAISWLWWAIAAATMLAGVQRVSLSRAVIAVLAGPLLLIGAGTAGFVGWALPALRSVPPGILTNPALATAVGDSRDLHKALLAYASVNGRWPDHAVRLILDDFTGASPFWLDRPADGMPMAGQDLWAYRRADQGDKARIRAAVEPVLVAAAPGLVAHRVGDVVFTYHGVPTPEQGGDSGLWLLAHLAVPPGTSGARPPAAGGAPTGPTGPAAPPAPASGETTIIISPSPIGTVQVQTGSGAPPLADPMVVVRTLGGSAVQIKLDQLPAALKIQNEMRARAGLPPLNDLLTITADQPQRSARAEQAAG